MIPIVGINVENLLVQSLFGSPNVSGMSVEELLMKVLDDEQTPPAPPHHKGLVTFKMAVSGWNVTTLEEVMTFVLREKESGKFITCRYVNYTDETYSRSVGGYTIPCRDRYFKFTASLTDYSGYSSGTQVPAYTGRPHQINTTMLSTQNISYYVENPDAKRDGEDPSINEIYNRYITLEIDPGTYEIIEVYCTNDDLGSITEFTVDDYTLDHDGKMTVTINHEIQYAKFDMSDDCTAYRRIIQWYDDWMGRYVNGTIVGVYFTPLLVHNNLKYLESFELRMPPDIVEDTADFGVYLKINGETVFSPYEDYGTFQVDIWVGTYNEGETVDFTYTPYIVTYYGDTYDIEGDLEQYTKPDFGDNMKQAMEWIATNDHPDDPIEYQYDYWYFSKEYAQYGAENNVTYVGLYGVSIKQAPYYTVP